jgi:hypothetical protein
MLKIIICLLCLSYALMPVLAEDTLSLRNVMQDINRAYTDLSKGIMLEDWKLIKRSANSIAFHAKPKSEVPLIARELKGDFAKFKSFDMRVHSAGTNIIKAVSQKKMGMVISNTQVMLSNCVQCHTEFRTRIIGALRPSK